MAEELLEVVERLQSRLSDNQEPRKLLKTLKRLGDLPMTVDILVETGVGKSVNSLRKHDIAGEVAKTLVAKWKKLVPQSADRPPSTKEGQSQSRAGDAVQGRKRARDPSPEKTSYAKEPEEEFEEEEEQGGYHHSYSPSPPHSYNPHGHSRAHGYESEEYESPPEEEPEPSPPRKEHRVSHKDPGRGQGIPSGHDNEQMKKRHAQGASGGAKRDDHKSSKHNRRSNVHESKKEKKDGSEGKTKRDEPRTSQAADDEEEERFEAPTMSFESFLTYDAPISSKKKKKPHRSSHSAQPKVTPTTAAPSKPSKTKTNGVGSKKRSEATKYPEPPVSSPPMPEKRSRKVDDVVSVLPDIPLPAIQPNYRPLPSIDPVSPQRRKVPVSYDEEDAGFTGRRFNSKMVVYSGSKTSYLPKMMTLYEQCIRVLQNNINSIDEVGGVPFEILEPVLERCTPEQLYRIEQCNPYFVQETDELWMRHCQRDFKREEPQEYESWREMYLRLHDQREERLRMLTQNISSAHANRPKGRQVKMAFVNSAVKPPRDIRRRQEKFGTKGAAPSSATSSVVPVPFNKTIVPYNAQSSSEHVSEASRSEPSCSFAPSSSGAGPSPRDKPQVKKIAPMMAKTIKAFKNRFSRR
ncbi:elongin-A isoform X2 [Denticeps clupeoides]|uniref:elongin-A isoform X2 n=1 Tax=Denticeps clupeoides TaxID=299321 RepID=UPI0010A30839|nr:elongin-A isoform X2 [Denticeps clupeoides]